MYVDYDPDLAAIGAIEPVFVEEFDYHATKRVVLDREIEVQWVSEMSSDLPVQALGWHYEDCDINVYKTVLKWRSTVDSAVSDANLNFLEALAEEGRDYKRASWTGPK